MSEDAISIMERILFMDHIRFAIIFGDEGSGKTALLHSFIRNQAKTLFKTGNGALPLYFDAKEILPWIETCRAVGGDARPFLIPEELLRYFCQRENLPLRPKLSIKEKSIIALFINGEINIFLDSLDTLTDFPPILNTLLDLFMAPQLSIAKNTLLEKRGGRIFLCARPNLRYCAPVVEHFHARFGQNLQPGSRSVNIFNMEHPEKVELLRSPTKEEMAALWPELSGQKWENIQRGLCERISARADEKE